MSAPSCRLCHTLPGTLRTKQRETLCVCGFELQFHFLGHPHRFTGCTPSCPGFQERASVPASSQRAGAESPQQDLFGATVAPA
jgi:hypothetical protein